MSDLDPPDPTASLTVLEFVELQASIMIGLRIAGFDRAELNLAAEAASNAIILHRAKQRQRPQLRVVSTEPTDAA